MAAIDLEASCDRLAEKYAQQYWDEMERKPFDRKMLDWLVERVNGRGVICDLGCGAGQVARYLQSRGCEINGIDLSSEMVKQARRLNPEIHFQQGDMMALTAVEDDTYGGLVSFYSIVHVPRTAVQQALRELMRVLRSEGMLLLTFYVGHDVLHLDELWEEDVSVDYILFQPEEMKAYLSSVGFEVEDVVIRESYVNIEFQSRHAYIFARKPQECRQ